MSSSKDASSTAEGRAPDWPLLDQNPLRLRDWFPSHVLADGSREAALTTDDLLRCREQALHSAAIMFDIGGQFPEDEADRVISMAKRFERFMRTGE